MPCRSGWRKVARLRRSAASCRGRAPRARPLKIRLSGSNFVPGSASVLVSGTGISVEAVNVSSSAQLTTTFTIDPAAATGMRDVTVQTPDGTSNPISFKARAPILRSCPVSLPLTATRKAGTVNILAGLSASGQPQGSWLLGTMIFNPASLTFQGQTLFSGALPPSLTYLTTANVGAAPVVGVLNAVYNPHLCGYGIEWPSGTVSREQLEILLNSLDLGRFRRHHEDYPALT